ncbi:hypothetical protein CLU79DRAFT_754343 [Phycomyces nitens]|nr:hypothetical protein CLU79DRAFT_754343 [Phycomyces nitens]
MSFIFWLLLCQTSRISLKNPNVVCQMANWRDCLNIQSVYTTRAPLPQIMQHTSKTHLTTNSIEKVTVHQTIYTTTTYDRAYHVTEKVTISSIPSPSNTATIYSPTPESTKEEAAIWKDKSPAEKANR